MEVYSGFKKQDTKSDVTQCTICSDEKGMCHVSLELGRDMKLRPCFDDKGCCTVCTNKCHYSLHQNTHSVYVAAVITEEIEIS